MCSVHIYHTITNIRTSYLNFYVNVWFQVSLPTISDVLEILCALQQGTTLRAVCERFSAAPGPTFDIRRLVVFAQLHGLIKCLKR